MYCSLSHKLSLYILCCLKRMLGNRKVNLFQCKVYRIFWLLWIACSNSIWFIYYFSSRYCGLCLCHQGRGSHSVVNTVVCWKISDGDFDHVDVPSPIPTNFRTCFSEGGPAAEQANKECGSFMVRYHGSLLQRRSLPFRLISGKVFFNLSHY